MSRPDIPGSQSIGSYRVNSVLGQGGFATVFRCTDERLEDDVAIKVLADNHALDPDLRARFTSEGRLIRKIDHEHLIRVHDVGETDRGQPYLELELADRGHLGARVEELRSQGWEPTARDVEVVAEAMLSAADALHRHQLVHRDIKPDNILIRSTNRSGSRGDVGIIGDDERLIVSDLGFAKDLAVNSGFTLAGGTAGFGAPEQMTGDRVTQAADVFAAARVVEWLVGPPNDRDWRQRLDAALQPALRTDPAERPQSAMDFLATLRSVLADNAAPVTQVVQESARPETESTSVLHRFRPAVLALLALLVVAIVAVGAVLLRGDNSDDTDPEAVAARVIEPLGDGAVIEIRGPTEVQRGAEFSVIASGPPGVDFTWTLPDGDRITGTHELVITPESSGTASIELEARTEEGDIVNLTYDFRVTDS